MAWTRKSLMQLQNTARTASVVMFAWAIGGVSAFAADEATITGVQVRWHVSGELNRITIKVIPRIVQQHDTIR